MNGQISVNSVIVADDDADIRTLVAIAVSKAKLELIDELEDGVSAWEAIQTFVPDIVILDVAMPGLTGLEVSRLIRADPRMSGMRVILLSASAEDTSREAGLESGANEYLLKPFSPRVLAGQLAAVAAEIGG